MAKDESLFGTDHFIIDGGLGKSMNKLPAKTPRDRIMVELFRMATINRLILEFDDQSMTSVEIIRMIIDF